MLKVILTKGLPASGKTTWAKQLMAEHKGQYHRVNKDDLRAMLNNSVWSKRNEAHIIRVRDLIIMDSLAGECSVIVDDTNLHPKHEEHIRELVAGKAEVVIQDFTDVPLEVCLERDKHRPNYVGEKVITDMYLQYLAPKIESVLYDPTLRNAVLCDLDGTLALPQGRNPYDASKCEQDKLDTVLALMLEKWQGENTDIILVSGRMDTWKEETIRWLTEHRIAYDHLHMRKGGDMRRDSIVKNEIYEEYIKGKYNVLFVLDDRSQVVRLWRSLGLKCLQVAPGEF
jgi:predicted kinase